VESVASYLQMRPDLVCAPFLELIAGQAVEADRTRSVAPAVIEAIKGSDLIRYSAARAIGGAEGTVFGAGEELEAVAGACASTAWCLWNHLCVFHHYCTLFGTDAEETLAGIAAAREWVTYPNGAGSGVTGTLDGKNWVLEGTITFASGARYGEWALVMFSHESAGEEGRAVSHGLVRLDAPGVEVVPTWDGMAVRASATDDVKLNAVRVPATEARRFYPDYAARARKPEWPVVDGRYREDWAGISSLWLAAQATGLARAALDDAVGQAAVRRAIGGAAMAQRPAVQLNLGDAAALIASARATWMHGCHETDTRISAGQPPDDAAHLRQFGYAMASIRQTGEAMGLLVRVLGGNGQRESGTFERRWRDFQAMAVHIICHPDRVNEMTGKWLLGIQP
jgi:indole-3-acetate monooxygenase